MDIIATLFQTLLRWVDQLDAWTFTFWLRLALLLGLPTLVCWFVLAQGNRSVVGQVICFVTSAWIVVLLPLHRIQIRNSAMKAWIFVISIILAGTLPAFIPRVLAPTFGQQLRLKKICYAVVALLLVANLIGGCR
jgi:hypothetical protein